MTGDIILVDDWSAQFGAKGGFPRYGTVDGYGPKKQVPNQDRSGVQRAWEIMRDTVKGSARDITHPGEAVKDRLTNPALEGWRTTIADWGKVAGIYLLFGVLLVLGLVFLVSGTRGGSNE